MKSPYLFLAALCEVRSDLKKGVRVSRIRWAAVFRYNCQFCLKMVEVLIKRVVTTVVRKFEKGEREDEREHTQNHDRSVVTKWHG